MSTYGVIYCAYQAEDLVPRSLAPWVAARAAKLGNHAFIICAVSVPFEGFDHGGTPLDGTQDLLYDALAEGRIDRLISPPTPMKETEARGTVLRWLVEQGVDATVMVDADEFWTEAQIAATLSFVESNPWVTWFRIPYKQIVFDRQHYLAEPFTPPRIHRVAAGGYRASGFWDDNNVVYTSLKHPDHTKRDIDLASLTVPKEAAWVPHETWISNLRSKQKVEYQIKARGWECSFKWNDETGLAFNEAYYAARGLPLPEVVSL